MLLVYLLWWFMKLSSLDSLDFSRIKGRDIGRNFLYFLLLLANNALGVNLLRQLGEATTANQETIQGVASLAPQLAMGLLIVVVAPLGEEIICRAVIWLGLLFLPIYIHQVILVPGLSMGACPSS